MEIFAIFAALMAAGVAQGMWKRHQNPFISCSWSELPAPLRDEVERLLPGLTPTDTRLTRDGDKLRASGERAGERFRIEADMGPEGQLLELEIDTSRSMRTTGSATPEALPEAVRRELDRVLGDQRDAFEIGRVTTGTTREGEPAFEVKGRVADWSYEVEISASGQLLEFEREKRFARR